MYPNNSIIVYWGGLSSQTGSSLSHERVVENLWPSPLQKCSNQSEGRRGHSAPVACCMLDSRQLDNRCRLRRGTSPTQKKTVGWWHVEGEGAVPTAPLLPLIAPDNPVYLLNIPLAYHFNTIKDVKTWSGERNKPSGVCNCSFAGSAAVPSDEARWQQVISACRGHLCLKPSPLIGTVQGISL